MLYRNICLIGGTGFVGTQLASKLVARGHTVRIPSRRPERHRALEVLPTVQLMQCNVHDEAELRGAMRGCDAVINLAGILNEFGKRQTFRQVHVELPRKIAQACRSLGIGRLLHMSALKADPGNAPSLFLRSKGEGEAALRVHAGNEVHYTVFQPSVIFGPDDSFINRFAGLLRMSPLLFPLACPQARFQPVYVGDVAAAFVQALDARDAHGRRYALCGPKTYTLAEIVRWTRDQLGLRTKILGLPGPLGKLQAAMLNLVPGKPFSLDNWYSLQVDTVCEAGGDLPGLGIAPAPMEAIVSDYLSR